MWSLSPEKPAYTIKLCDDDTLRVVLIGDSWVGMHHKANYDMLLQDSLKRILKSPVVVKSQGKGGIRSKELYNNIFQTEGYGSKSILMNGADYCVVIVGINDAAANLGTLQFCHHYRLILDFLLLNHVKPVIVEIPNVNLWHVYREKPLCDLMVDYIKSCMTSCKMYNYEPYRDALNKMIVEERYTDKVVFVPMECWNGKQSDVDLRLFLDDQIHLNQNGYELLNRCVAVAIADDIRNSRRTLFD